MEYWHCMLAGEERATLLPDEQRLRAGVRAVAAVVAREVIAFNVVDSHLHLVLLGGRGRVGRLAQATALALRPLVSAPLAQARIKEVNGRSHLERLVAYVLRQDLGHGTNRHPALSAGSCFQDLAGARAIPGLRLRLADVLPRYRLSQAFAEVGLEQRPIRLADDAAISFAGAARLMGAAEAACCVGPAMGGTRTKEATRARRAAASLARQAGLRLADLARLGRRSERSMRALATLENDEAAEAATRVRLALEDRVAETRGLVAERSPPAFGEDLEGVGEEWEYRLGPVSGA